MNFTSAYFLGPAAQKVFKGLICDRPMDR